MDFIQVLLKSSTTLCEDVPSSPLGGEAVKLDGWLAQISSRRR